MTNENEEARRILIQNMESLKANPLVTVDDCLYKAFDTAIKALEQQPSEDVLDNIKAEIIEKFDNCSICEWFEDYDYDENDISEYISVGHISDIIDIIDKYIK